MASRPPCTGATRVRFCRLAAIDTSGEGEITDSMPTVPGFVGITWDDGRTSTERLVDLEPVTT